MLEQAILNAHALQCLVCTIMCQMCNCTVIVPNRFLYRNNIVGNFSDGANFHKFCMKVLYMKICTMKRSKAPPVVRKPLSALYYTGRGIWQLYSRV